MTFDSASLSCAPLTPPAAGFASGFAAPAAGLASWLPIFAAGFFSCSFAALSFGFGVARLIQRSGAAPDGTHSGTGLETSVRFAKSGDSTPVP